MRFSKYFFDPIKFKVSLIVLIVLFSCKGNNNADQNDAAIEPYKLPETKDISKSESQKYHNQCQEWYDTTLANTGFSGSILVAKNGNIVFEKYNGVLHLGSNDSINENTPIHIASASKTFTAMLILKLYQEKKLQLDDEFSKYFADFNYPGVTIRNLLNHRSGLPNYVHFMDELGWDKSKMATNKDVYNYLISRKSQLKQINKPNVGFKYSNTNYALLALLIEKITNSTYPSYLKHEFFDPLEMKNSFVMIDPIRNDTSNSFDQDGKLFNINHLDGVYGDKNIYSTVQDLFKWDKFLKSNILFTPETLEQAYTPYSHEKDGKKNYGLGWRMNVYPNGNKFVFHNGWWHGNNSCFIRLLKEDAVIIILGNRYNNRIYKGKNLISIFSQLYDNSEDE